MVPKLNTAYRNPVIEELKETEASYNSSLKLLIKALDAHPSSNKYLLELRYIIKELHSDSEALSSIFEKLCPQAMKKMAAQKNLFADLAKIDENNRLKHQNTQSILDFQHLHFGLFMQHYRVYSKLFLKYQHESMQDPNAFIVLDTWLRTNTPKGLGLGDHVSMPFQRGPRYSLLLAALIKNPAYVDETLLDAFKEVLRDCTTELANINKTLQNIEQEYTAEYDRLNLYRLQLGQKYIKQPKTCEPLLKAIQFFMDECSKNEGQMSIITRRDLLCQTNDMLQEKNPELLMKKIKNYKKTAATLPGHAMSKAKTAALGTAMLVLASATAAAILLLTSAPLSIPVLIGTAAAALSIAGSVTFFSSRHQSGIAKSTNQLTSFLQ